MDVGGSFNIGRPTLPSAIDATTGAVSYGVAGQSPGSAGTFFFTEADMTYTLADVTYNAEVDYGQQQHAAFNGGQAQWYGISLLAHRKFNIEGIGRMGVTARYDYLADSKNGGGGGGVALNSSGRDPYNRVGIGSECLSNSQGDGRPGLRGKGPHPHAVRACLRVLPRPRCPP